MAFNINLRQFLSDQESFDATLLRVTAGDSINFSLATLSGFLDGSDLPADGFFTLTVDDSGDASDFSDTINPFFAQSESTPPAGAEPGANFLFQQFSMSFAFVPIHWNEEIPSQDGRASYRQARHDLRDR